MNKETLDLRNRILFDSERKVEVPSESNEIHLPEAITANEEFSRFGFTLDTKGIMALAHNTPEDMAQIKDSICRTLEFAIGISDYKMSVPFYPNFPEEVMEKDEVDLRINAMMYYAFSQTDDPEMTEIAQEIRNLVVSSPEDQIEREPLPIDRGDLSIMSAADSHEVEDLLHDRTQALSISSLHLNDIEEYANAYPNTWIGNLFGTGEKQDVSMPSHETRANMAKIAFRMGDVETAGKMMPNAEDVLRFASAISKDERMNANLSVEPQNAVFKFSRPEKTAIKGFLETSPDLFTSMWHREGMWEKLMNRLDTRDNRFPRMEKAFDNLRNDNRVNEDGVEIKLSAGQRLERMMENIKQQPDTCGTEIENFAKDFPKVFVRNIERIGRELPTGSDTVQGLLNGIEKNLSDVPTVQLLKLEHHIERADGWDNRVFVNQKGGIHMEENTVGKIDIRIKAAILNSLDKVIEQNLTKDPVGKVYIAPELDTIAAPLRNVRNASDGAVLTKYSVINGEKDNNIAAFGIFWKNQGSERADIDLSVIGYKENHQGREHIWYGNLKTDWGVHSGDYTSGVIAKEINGAVEYVFVDKQKCQELGIRYLMPAVNGFNIPFSQADSVRFCFMEKSGQLQDVGNTFTFNNNDTDIRNAPTFQGELINPTEIQTSYRLTQDARATVPLLFDLKTEKYIWIDADIAVNQISCIEDAVMQDKASVVLYEARHNDYPTIGELAKRYTEANGGEIVTDIKEADLIFSFGNIDREALGLKDEVEIITNFEQDKISATLCSATEIPERDEDKPKDVEQEESKTDLDFWDDDDIWDPID